MTTSPDALPEVPGAPLEGHSGIGGGIEDRKGGRGAVPSVHSAPRRRQGLFLWRWVCERRSETVAVAEGGGAVLLGGGGWHRGAGSQLHPPGVNSRAVGRVANV